MANTGMVYAPNVNSYLSSVSDATYAYFAAYDSPAAITRLNKATFAVVDVLTLSASMTYIQAASIDLAAQTAYFGTYQAPGRVAVVDLTTFTNDNRSLTLPGGVGLIFTSSIQPATGGLPATVYYGTGSSPGSVVRVDTTPTASPTRVPTASPSQRPTRTPTPVSAWELHLRS